jgi:hypothetical protein
LAAAQLLAIENSPLKAASGLVPRVFDAIEVINTVTANAKSLTISVIDVALNITGVIKANMHHRPRPRMKSDSELDSEVGSNASPMELASGASATTGARAGTYNPRHTGDDSLALSEGKCDAFFPVIFNN